MLVLEGEVFLGVLRVAPGDYHLARGGTLHGQISSPHGRAAVHPQRKRRAASGLVQIFHVIEIR